MEGSRTGGFLPPANPGEGPALLLSKHQIPSTESRVHGKWQQVSTRMGWQKSGIMLLES